MDFLDDSEKRPEPVKPKAKGTFQSMGLSRLVLKAVERKGYKLATPIQRKCIPSIMTGRDVVAMARTGSGKSAAFLLPLIDKLKIRQPKADIRALILTPTRELATQTYKFVREFTKFTNLVSKLIIGGESISKDFETITSCPDILVATPGRLAHILVEMKQKLNNLEIVVMDEADRLFEPGFKEIEQVNEICSRLPDHKQTLLFSATMPQKLADFAKAGLKNPLFIRLDVETSLSESLKTIYLHCNQQDKYAILVHLLKKFVTKGQMAVVFMPTKHHIEYTKLLLDNARIDCTQVYSTMDPEARKINIDKFTKKICSVMLVTDLAARGIDIPILDVVINFNFPFKPKLFIHRVGRVARAGRNGCAISLVSYDETPYLHALHMFLDEPIRCASEVASKLNLAELELTTLPDKILGSVPQDTLDEENEILKCWHDHNEDLQAMAKVCDNAMKPYLKTREAPEPYSVKAAKEVHKKVIGIHPIFKIKSNQSNQTPHEDSEMIDKETNLLERIKSYKPQATIFEVGHIKGNRRTEAFEVMQKKRQFHDKVAAKRVDINDDEGEYSDDMISENSQDDDEKLQIESNVKKSFEDSKFYLKYKPDDYVKEKGLELDKNSFNNDLKRATFDLIADDEDQMKRQKHQTVWDRKRKRFVKSDDDQKKVKKIKTESGAYISASYKSGLFEKWKSQSKFEHKLSDDEDGDDNSDSRPKSQSFKKGRGRKGGDRKQISLEKLRTKLKPNNRRSELKRPEVMMKERNLKDKREAILRLKTQAKAARKNGGSKSGGSKSGGSKSGGFKSGGGGGKKTGKKQPHGGAGAKNKQRTSNRKQASKTPKKSGASRHRR